MCLLKSTFLSHYEHRFRDLSFDAQINTVKYLYFCETMAAIMASAIQQVREYICIIDIEGMYNRLQIPGY